MTVKYPSEYVCIEHLEFVPCPDCDRPHPEWYSNDIIAKGIIYTRKFGIVVLEETETNE